MNVEKLDERDLFKKFPSDKSAQQRQCLAYFVYRHKYTHTHVHSLSRILLPLLLSVNIYNTLMPAAVAVTTTPIAAKNQASILRTLYTRNTIMLHRSEQQV